MERMYALGVTIIEFIQDRFEDSAHFFETVNNLSNPHHVLELLFPIVSIVDSVFAAQLLLCMAFGGWLNAVMKWWLLEDRPYWWVRETSFYSESRRPQLRQTTQTCETGPGCPSGHTATTAMLLLLVIMWISHVMNDRKLYIWWWKYAVYPVFAVTLGTVMLARMFVATHFPHQCLLGAFVGSFLSPALCIYVSDPYIWRYGRLTDTTRAVFWHAFSALVTIAISVVTYYSLVLCGVDPQWTVKLRTEAQLKRCLWNMKTRRRREAKQSQFVDKLKSMGLKVASQSSTKDVPLDLHMENSNHSNDTIDELEKSELDKAEVLELNINPPDIKRENVSPSLDHTYVNLGDGFTQIKIEKEPTVNRGTISDVNDSDLEEASHLLDKNTSLAVIREDLKLHREKFKRDMAMEEELQKLRTLERHWFVKAAHEKYNQSKIHDHARQRQREEELHKLKLEEQQWLVKAAKEQYDKAKLEKENAEEILRYNQATRKKAEGFRKIE